MSKEKEKSDRIPLLLDKVGDIYNCGVLKSVLMLLSISSSPIENLLLYLKKNGMEKLIELLNEYDSGWSYDDYYGPFQYGQDRDAYHLCKYQLVSKEYGFIKWLVDNDKIDTEKEIKNSELNWLHEHYFREDCLLMLLSISDTPIEDLVSYLI